MKSQIWTFHILVVGLAMTIYTNNAAAQDGAERGKALVTQYCSECHAVGLMGGSPNPKAPPFRELSKRFPIDALEETFIDAIDTGHPGMPVFKATREQIDAIIDYIAVVME